MLHKLLRKEEPVQKAGMHESAFSTCKPERAMSNINIYIYIKQCGNLRSTFFFGFMIMLALKNRTKNPTTLCSYFHFFFLATALG